MTFRVLAGQFMHETNTFSVQPADIPACEKLFCSRGAEEIAAHRAGTTCETAGFMAAAEALGWELIHTVAACANPCG
jgi:microcystin degradation protein MlrC